MFVDLCLIVDKNTRNYETYCTTNLKSQLLHKLESCLSLVYVTQIYLQPNTLP